MLKISLYSFFILLSYRNLYANLQLGCVKNHVPWDRNLKSHFKFEIKYKKILCNSCNSYEYIGYFLAFCLPRKKEVSIHRILNCLSEIENKFVCFQKNYGFFLEAHNFIFNFWFHICYTFLHFHICRIDPLW